MAMTCAPGAVQSSAVQRASAPGDAAGSTALNKQDKQGAPLACAPARASSRPPRASPVSRVDQCRLEHLRLWRRRAQRLAHVMKVEVEGAVGQLLADGCQDGVQLVVGWQPAGAWQGRGGEQAWERAAQAGTPGPREGLPPGWSEAAAEPARWVHQPWSVGCCVGVQP